jgi:starch phosphorylase
MDDRSMLFPHLPEELVGLEEIAENLWWSWNPAARMLFKTLDRRAWKESGHNPDKMLRSLPKETLEAAVRDANYMRHYRVVRSRFRKATAPGPCPLLRESGCPTSATVVYFSAEYGLHHSLPFYAGGLGFLAGDYLKECSDLNVPLVAVGFMYPEGYVRQRIREDGWQESLEEPLDREAASISRVPDQGASRLVVQVPFIEPPIFVSVWKISVGRVSLYLMDTDIEENHPWNRAISARLYTGDVEHRLRQEIVLGIGGSEVLERLGIRHTVLHLNEGHAAFALLERIRDRVEAGMGYEDAAREVQASSVFTTHTPVPAGHDIFPFHLMEKYFSAYWPSLGIDHDAFLRLGMHPDEPDAGFNMTAFALRMSGNRNGVSARHGEVARRMWRGLWRDLPEDQVPIHHVTNGVHVPTWIEPKMELLFNEYLGSNWLEDHDNPYVWDLIEEIPDERLWQTHTWLKIKLLNAVRDRARQRWIGNRSSSSVLFAGGTMLDPAVLTIGFARRFATYKRADLILHDRERLKRLVNDRWRPIQIIFAGKAHPADDGGKAVLQRVFNAARDPQMGGRIAFLEDYGEQFAQYLVHGVDVWLNNPLPPMEASGTSGMKAALNGVPQLSIVDGWWAEGFNGKNGWAVGAESDDQDRDRKDAESIYRILEEEVIPKYYNFSDKGVPREWVRVMKDSIKSVGSAYSARRMVKDYIKKLYVTAMTGS